jgi:glyoxylase-like metal-dependent hydrolase (beta-lactamase superfamily II)
MEITKLRLSIGPYAIKPIATGQFALDGGAMFGTVPRVLWQKSNPPDELNRIPMEARALLLLGSERKILVDTGIGGDFVEKFGEKLGSKFARIYDIDSKQASLTASLAAVGLRTGDITDVILTHLHFDHAGGATEWREGRMRPAFANARYYVQRANLEAARQPNALERASYFPANFQPLLDAGVLTALDGPVEGLLPGVSVRVSNGHTRGQQIVLVEGESGLAAGNGRAVGSEAAAAGNGAAIGNGPAQGWAKLAYCADLIPTSSHVRVPWIMGYDLHPLDIMEEKRALLAQAAAQGWTLFFEHDAYVDAARVEAVNGDFAVTERLRLE